MNEETALERIPSFALERTPDIVLGEARKAASALKDILDKKPNPVKFGGEQYLEYEDWQTLGRFYGITAKVISTDYVTYNGANGFEAKAEAILVSNGQVISGAEALCLNDERNWKDKPLYQLKSMAQTRAGAKVLRNVLAWVVVLAGYKPTPAEEMTEAIVTTATAANKQAAKPLPQIKVNSGKTISEAQRKRFYAKVKAAGIPDEIWIEKVKSAGYESTKEINWGKPYDDLCSWADTWTPLEQAIEDSDEAPYNEEF